MQTLDQQQRGGTTERDGPGANAEERGSRANTDERRKDATKNRAEDADQQSADLRFAVDWNGRPDPARDNSQDHPRSYAHCAPLSMNAGHETSTPTRMRSHTMLDGIGRSGYTA
jgi:hypothetical protein